jgi:hypothetical protein
VARQPRSTPITELLSQVRATAEAVRRSFTRWSQANEQLTTFLAARARKARAGSEHDYRRVRVAAEAVSRSDESLPQLRDREEKARKELAQDYRQWARAIERMVRAGHAEHPVAAPYIKIQKTFGNKLAFRRLRPRRPGEKRAGLGKKLPPRIQHDDELYDAACAYFLGLDCLDKAFGVSCAECPRIDCPCPECQAIEATRAPRDPQGEIRHELVRQGHLRKTTQHGQVRRLMEALGLEGISHAEGPPPTERLITGLAHQVSTRRARVGPSLESSSLTPEETDLLTKYAGKAATEIEDITDRATVVRARMRENANKRLRRGTPRDPSKASAEPSDPQ